MSSREYFSLRYAAPGFSLILVIIGLNFYPIFEILKESVTNNVFGIVLSFLSLFAGSAIGFIVAQIWFAYFTFRKLDAKRIFKHSEKDMENHFGWAPGDEVEDKDSTLSAVLDYMLLFEKDKNKWGYCQRKWDIYHIMSTTLVSLIFGVGVGLILRTILSLYFFGGISLSWFPKSSIPIQTDFLFFVFTLINVFSFTVIIYFVRRQIFNEYNRMLRIFIVRMGCNKEFIKELNAAFPGYFKKIPLKVVGGSKVQRATGD